MLDTKTYKSKIETVNETIMLRTIRKYYQNFPAVLTEWYTIVLLVTSLGCSNSVWPGPKRPFLCLQCMCCPSQWLCTGLHRDLSILSHRTRQLQQHKLTASDADACTDQAIFYCRGLCIGKSADDFLDKNMKNGKNLERNMKMKVQKEVIKVYLWCMRNKY